MVDSSTLPTSIHNTLEKVHKRFPAWDPVMAFDVFLFFLSFWILEFEEVKDRNYGARAWLWYFIALFMLDLFFRLLSIKVESINREYWNWLIPCIFTPILYLLAAYYDFDDVFGSNPTQGFNIFLFIVFHFGIIGYTVMGCLFGNNQQETN